MEFYLFFLKIQITSAFQGNELRKISKTRVGELEDVFLKVQSSLYELHIWIKSNTIVEKNFIVQIPRVNDK